MKVSPITTHTTSDTTTPTTTKTDAQHLALSVRIHALFGTDLLVDHQDFFVINKKSGLACHGPDSENLADLLSSHNIPALLCHRLDKETSGLIIIAKSKQAADNFRKMFEAREIEKYYLALSHKKGKKKQGSIKGQLKKSRNGNWILSPNPKQETMIKTQFFSFALNDRPGLRCFVIKLHGGKTHQIRVCLKANGSPVLGDIRYGGQHAQRLYLHAYGLKFKYGEQTLELISEPDTLSLSLNSLNPLLNNSSAPWLLQWPK